MFLIFRTISDPPGTVDVYLETGEAARKFYQCDYGWWDHSIAIGMEFRQQTGTRKIGAFIVN